MSEQTKVCSTCGREKPLSEFNKKKGNRDGLQDRCRSCFSEYNKARYAKDPERHKKNVREYRAGNIENVFQTRLKMCEKNPNHKNANEAIRLAIESGFVERPDHCSGCGCSSSEHRIEAHHHDYSKPLDVIWLCTPCHRRMDQQRRAREGKEPCSKKRKG